MVANYGQPYIYDWQLTGVVVRCLFHFDPFCSLLYTHPKFAGNSGFLALAVFFELLLLFQSLDLSISAGIKHSYSVPSSH